MHIFHRDVEAFHRAMNLPIGDYLHPSIPDAATAELRRSLIEEEIWETVEKGLKVGGIYNGIKCHNCGPLGDDHCRWPGHNRLQAWEQVIDGLCDSMYVTVGAAISFGIDLKLFVPNLSTFPLPREPFECWKEKAELLLAAKRVACDSIRPGGVGRGDVNEAAVALSGLAATIGHVAAFYGIPLEEFWKEVQRANMAKVGGPVRSDGKRLKPPGWVGPNHLPLIRKYWPALVAV